MKWSRALIPTSKDTPADATTIGHQLLLRAGIVRQAGAGLFDLLPLGTRVLRKIEDIFRTEFNAAGAVEVQLASLQPTRPTTPPSVILNAKDRLGRTLAVLPPTAETLARLAGAEIRSHRQLPLTLFRTGPQFHDTERPRHGLLDARDNLTAEACSITAAPNDHATLRAAAIRAIERCGIPFDTVDTSGGCEFFSRCDSGEDFIVASDKGTYLATRADAQTGPRTWTFGGDPAGELETIPTPDVTTVGDVARFLRVNDSDVLKTMVFRATPSAEWTGYETPENLTTPQWVVAVVRGDHEVNVSKLAAAVREEFHITSITLATDADAGEFAFGYVGPDAAIRKVRAALVVDPDAAQDRPWIAGANEIGYHVRNFNWFRECGQPLADPRKVAVADIRNVVPGDPARDGGTLQLVRGVTLGHITPLPDEKSVTFQDDTGVQRTASITSCSVNLSRLLATAVETAHDDHGIIWPTAIAPYAVVITPIQYSDDTKSAADRLYADLSGAGVDVLLDDRDLRAGAKFADADLIGIPIRINVGERGLRQGVVELKPRTASTSINVELGKLVEAVAAAAAGWPAAPQASAARPTPAPGRP